MLVIINHAGWGKSAYCTVPSSKNHLSIPRQIDTGATDARFAGAFVSHCLRGMHAATTGSTGSIRDRPTDRALMKTPQLFTPLGRRAMTQGEHL